MKKPKIHTVESLLANTDEYGDCLLWKGSMGTGHGTPQVYHKGKMVAVRRLLQTLQGNPLKDGYYAAMCKEPRCIACEHTVFREPIAHMKKMGVEAKKPTNATKKKAAMIVWRRTNGNKLTFETAKVIRTDERPETAIAQEYGISRSMVGKIRRGEQWPDVASNPFAMLGQRA